MRSRLRDNRHKPFHQLQQSHLNRSCPIRSRCLQQYPILPLFVIHNQTTLRKWWPCNIPTKSLQTFSIPSGYQNTTMKIIATKAGTSRRKLELPTSKLLHTSNRKPPTHTRSRLTRNTCLALLNRSCCTKPNTIGRETWNPASSSR